MRFFLDSAVLDEARKARDWGLLDGVWVSPEAAEKASGSTTGGRSGTSPR